MFPWRIAFSCTVLCILWAATPPSAVGGPPVDGVVSKPADDAVFQHGAVAADHVAASRAGVEILQRGGNVVDAAVATSFALSVVRPSACGIGGGGFMLIWDAEKQQAFAIDYRERAPSAATREMFLDPDVPHKPRPDLSRQGGLAVAVPGTVAGLCFALEQYGTLDLPTVLAPAIRLCREGVPIDEHDREVQSATLRELATLEDGREFDTLVQQYLNGGKPWKTGDPFHSPQLKALELIASRGADGFYRGEVAEAIVAEIKRNGGIITAADLGGTKPVLRRTLHGTFDGFDVLTMPPPSSGGVAFLESLEIIAAYERVDPQRRLQTLGHHSPDSLHLLGESLKHAFADRAEFLGDPDFAEIPTERLISRAHAETLARRIDMQRTRPATEYGRGFSADDGGTSHFSIIDSRGNAVACTETINTLFGSFVVEPTYGIVLNNEMDDFAIAPGQANVFGLVQGESNAVGPGHKPLSSMSPTIVVKEGRARMALGASGGPLIISATLQVFLNMSRFGMRPDAAVAQPRMHHQWFPDAMLLEQPLLDRAGESLRERGHTVQLLEKPSVSQAVLRDDAGLHAASDPRRHGQPAGY